LKSFSKSERIQVPVYSRFGANVLHEGGELCCKDKHGKVTWAYSGKEVTGKGIYICACPRSGTLYITEVLRRLGYDIGHEKAEKDGSVGYHLAVVQPKNCFHQIRHPVKQISSMQVLSRWGFMDSVVNVSNHKLLGSMQLWLQWNDICESFCTWRYRIEDLPSVWNEFCSRIGHPYCSIPGVPTNTNTSKHNNLTWDDLFECNRQIARKIYEKSVYYGYSPERDREDYNKSQDRHCLVA
jgi:hypothetical protein